MPSAAARILLVEDDPACRESLADLLAHEGYRVSTAPDGSEALRFLRDHDLPDLILLDIMMPRVNGFHFRAEQRQDARLADVPVIMLSALVRAEVPPHGSLNTRILAKPVDCTRLLQSIREELHHPPDDPAAGPSSACQGPADAESPRDCPEGAGADSQG
jgi:two-component system, chemotaxis family, chemotaxis protein CheY